MWPLIVKSVIDRKPYHSFNFIQFSLPAISSKLASLFKKLVKFESGISIPMINDGKVIGAILYHKTIKEDFENELDNLIVFTDYVASVMYNLEQFHRLKRKLGKF